MRRVAANLAAAVLVLAGARHQLTRRPKLSAHGWAPLMPARQSFGFSSQSANGRTGALTGTMVSLDQAAASVPVDAIAVTGDRLHLEVKAARGAYDGTLNAEMNKVEGSWRQGVSALPLTLQKSRPEAVSQQPAQQAGGAEAVARKLVTCLAERKFQQATDSFDAKMKAVLPASKLQEAWDGLVAEVGALQSVKSVRTQNVLIYGLCHVACQFEKKPVTIRVAVNRDETVGGLDFLPGEGGQNQPPPYAQPALFQEKQVVIGGGEWSLPGTLAMPGGKVLSPVWCWSMVLVPTTGTRPSGRTSPSVISLGARIAGHRRAPLRKEDETVCQATRGRAIRHDGQGGNGVRCRGGSWTAPAHRGCRRRPCVCAGAQPGWHARAADSGGRTGGCRLHRDGWGCAPAGRSGTRTVSFPGFAPWVVVARREGKDCRDHKSGCRGEGAVARQRFHHPGAWRAAELLAGPAGLQSTGCGRRPGSRC